MSNFTLILRIFAGILEPELAGLFRAVVRGALLLILFQSTAIAQEISDPCAADLKQSEVLLHCVAGLVDSSTMNHDPRAVLKEPLRGYLRKLDSWVGYKGKLVDLDVLKRVSLALKQDAMANRDIISALDAAIASHADELRPAMSRETAAANVTNGTDIYSRFVEQRLNFLLEPERINFYRRGPFELPIYTSLANALESKYFLAKGDWDNNLLHQEIEALKKAHAMLLELPSNEPRRRSRLNGIMFWQASIFFALGDKEKFRQTLHDLVYENRDFGLENRSSGHVYIYRAFDLPFSMVVEEVGADGKPILSADDQYALNRFYNPGQLALAACDLAEAAGRAGIKTYSDAVRDLPFRDFYVVAASGSNPDALGQFGDQLLRSIQQGESGTRRDILEQEIITKAARLSAKIDNGATNCGITAELREQLYPPFGFKFQVKHLEAFGKHTEYLLLGGGLDADQANKLAEFLTSATSAGVRDQARNLGIESAPYTARVRIE